jgi:gliding motility-associated-like protein
MKQNASLLRTLYISASGKYLKLKNRLEKARQSGRFYTLSKRKQHSLIQRLKRLYERLKSLQTQIRLSGIGAAISLALGATNADAQSSLGPFVREDSKNPLPPPVQIALPKPASVDIDNDGDLDVFVGDKYGKIHFFRNEGGKDVVRRLRYDQENNPLEFVDVLGLAAPAFLDVDGDGDFDLLVGNSDGYTYFFRNTGTVSAPQFEGQTGSSNPFDGITGSITKYGSRGPALPTFADFDNDSDLDLIIGSNYIYDSKYSIAPATQIYRNTGGSFEQISNSIFSDLNYSTRLSLTFVDLDGDNDLDLFSGGQNGSIRAFLNQSGSFVEQYGTWNPTTRTGNPMHGSYVSGNIWMNLADMDDDGDLDLFVGTGNNFSTADNSDPISFFENTGNFVFERRTGLNISPFEGVDVTSHATPTFTDIDGDGDLDAILGGKYSFRLRLYRNNNGFLIEDKEDPIADLNVYDKTLPVFVDIDADGDQDLFVTSGYEEIRFFENTNNSFSETSSPIDLAGFSRPSIAFIDIDNDEDLDAFVFNLNSREIEFFRNTGTKDAPAFLPEATPDPLDALTFKYSSKITAADIDHDGDLDLIISESVYNSGYYTNFRFFDNLGNGSFTEITPTIFDEFASIYSFINMTDIDADGDLDIFLGYGNDHSGGFEGGTVGFFENQNIAPVTEVTKSIVSVGYNMPVILDSDINIVDPDGDDIVQATVTISNFSAGNEVLDFTPSAGVTGNFEDGELTITGKASIEEYETILRSVTYEATGDITSAKVAGRGIPPQDKNVTFAVRDVDFTRTVVSVVSVISLDITGEPGVIVYNAISPGLKDDKNDYLRIEGLAASNKVTILNRWGDKVFEVSNYDNDTRRFEGKNDSGKDLPSGTYYYQIETAGKTYSGYLSLRR